MGLHEKINYSIQIIQEYENLANMWNGGYTVCFSGGKDSQVLLDLFKKANVNFNAIYKCTTNDPPENVYFIRKNYPDVNFILPKRNFLQLIQDNNMLPTMDKRFCCRILKEYDNIGFTATGVRREESTKRGKYEEIEFKHKNPNKRLFTSAKIKKSSTIYFRPILNWTEQDVWRYIDDNNIPINPCYELSGRVGCLFCPYKNKITLNYYSKIYPKHFSLLLKSIQIIINNGYLRQFNRNNQLTPTKVWEWWISNKTADAFFNQLNLFEQC